MDKVSATVATTSIITAGQKFSLEALEIMVRELPGKPVLEDFDPDKVIGKVLTAKLNKNQGVEILAELLPCLHGGLYVVPKLEVQSDELKEGVFRNVKLLSCSLTNMPADGHLTPIQVVEPDEQDRGNYSNS